MKVRFLVFLIFVQCSVKSELSGEDKQTPINRGIDISEYRDSLSMLSVDSISSTRGLEIFTRDFDKNNSARCDEALKSFLEFQANVINELNEKLYKHPDFEKYNSLIWADQALHDSVGLKFAEQLYQNGLQVSSTEGTIYISRATEPIRKTFFNHLSSSTQLFFDQFEKEENQIYSDDGGLTITTTELADRLGFWEMFLMENPNHLFSDFASNNIRYYRYFLMVGMDNTPAFDFDSNKLLPEFENAFTHYRAHYTKTSTATILKTYQELLGGENNLQTSNVVQFLDQYKPWE